MTNSKGTPTGGSDHIIIRGLLLRCIIGIDDDERREKQGVLVNIRLSVDLARSAAIDDIADTVN